MTLETCPCLVWVSFHLRAWQAFLHECSDRLLYLGLPVPFLKGLQSLKRSRITGGIVIVKRPDGLKRVLGIF